jgi:NAD(P)-dependent dehydrogenase (short-subunit alcohol dehydrogenase family)
MATTASSQPTSRSGAEEAHVGMLAGRTMIVAGVGAGLGRAVAERAHAEGARLVLAARQLERIGPLAAALDPTGMRVRAVAADVTDPKACDRLVHAASGMGTLDALVVVAALDTVFGGIVGADLTEWRRAMEINFFGAMQLTAAAIDAFGEEGGSIVYVTTQTIYRPPSAVLQAGYAASKAALLGAARHLAVELGRRRIRVNTVAPGWMDGPAVEHYIQSTAAAEGVEPAVVRGRITANLPLGEMASDGDVADAIVYLCSPRARAITGQALLVNAGEHPH